MMKEERHKEIRQLLDTKGSASVADLSRRFRVTEMTIRRDLGELNALGAVQRIHGGVMSRERQGYPAEPPMLDRMREEAAGKRKIGLVAAGLIKAGETVLLGSGTTTLAVAEALAGRTNLTVITNALTIANSLVRSPGITVVVAGGFLRRSELSLIGHFADAFFRDVRADKVIIGIRGIHPEHGLTSDHLQELETDRAIMSISDHLIIVADHTKFGLVASSRVAPLTKGKMIITDRMPPPRMAKDIRNAGVEILVAK